MTFIATKILNFVLKNARRESSLRIADNKKYGIIDIQGEQIYLPYRRALITKKFKVFINYYNDSLIELKTKRGFPFLLSPNDLNALSIVFKIDDSEIVIRDDERLIDIL